MGPKLDELRSGAGSRHRCFTEVESYMVRYRRQRMFRLDSASAEFTEYTTRG